MTLKPDLIAETIARKVIIKLMLPMLLIFSSSILYASPCRIVLFDYVCNDPVEVVGHEVMIQWHYNKCEGYDRRGDLFIVEVQNIFGEVQLRDTVKGFSYKLHPRYLDSATDLGLTFFQVREVNEEKWYQLSVSHKERDQDIPEDTIERFNFFLLNGYFLNALALVDQIGNPELLEKLSADYRLLFPSHSLGDCDFFNSYLDSTSKELVTMPYVIGLFGFESDLNEAAKKEGTKGESFDIELWISPDNQVDVIKVGSDRNAAIVKQLIPEFIFMNPHTKRAMVLIRVKFSVIGRKFIVTNKKALTDPDSDLFRKLFRYRRVRY